MDVGIERNTMPLALGFPDASETVSAELIRSSGLEAVTSSRLAAPFAVLSSDKGSHLANIFQCERTPQLQAASARFIRQQYWDAHKATLNSLMFTRFAILGADMSPSAVVGIKRFGAETTLVEKYLDQPIEYVIAELIGQRVQRQSIVEVGNLAAHSLLHSCRLIVFLLHWLSKTGTSHAVCTGTEAVRLALKRARVPFTTIGDADATRLGDDRYQWGSYYNNTPQVLMIDIAAGLAAVSDRYRCDFAGANGQLASAHTRSPKSS